MFLIDRDKVATELTKFFAECPSSTPDVGASVNNILHKQPELWIDVNERLPTRSGRYLTHCNFDGNSLVVVLWFEKYNERFDDEVTHWMPLPKPPIGF